MRSSLSSIAGFCLLAPLTLPACADAFGTRDARELGAPLGTFHVSASQKLTTCGQGALGSAASWEFDVKLARGKVAGGANALFWDNGAETIAGSLAADGVTFAFETAVVVDMRAAEASGLPPCSVRRRDRSAGALDSAGLDVRVFTGSLSYDFAAEPGSECSDLVYGEAPILAALPCSMVYELSAQSIAAPEGESASIREPAAFSEQVE